MMNVQDSNIVGELESENDTTILSLIFERLVVGVCFTHHRVITRCNSTFAEIFGYAPNELVNKSMQTLFPSQADFERIDDLARHSMFRTGEYCDDRIMMRKSGDLFWCRVAGRTFNKTDPLADVMWVIQDLTPAKLAEQKMTAREREVAMLVLSGHTSKEIGKLLGISFRTVQTYRKHLMERFGAKNAAELAQRLRGM